MPRVRPLTETQRKNESLTRQIWGCMKVKGMSGESVAECLSVGKNTFYRRMKNPSAFTLGELRILKKIFPTLTIE